MCQACSIKEKEQILVGSESEWCVRVGRHDYPRIVVSVSYTIKKNPTKCVGLVQNRPHHHLIEN
jgi:hypothetical protein